LNQRELKNHLYELVSTYFAGATVIWAQTNTVKPPAALVTLKTGLITRTLYPIMEVRNGVSCGYYPSKTALEINLFTKGAPIVSEGETIAYENTAVADLTEFLNFVGSPHVIAWCLERDIDITPSSDVLDVTALISDTQWEYRAMVELEIDFVQYAIGATGILDETSIVDGGIDPKWNGPTPSGGGTQELADKDIGYFQSVEVEKEKEEY
jgi:hypothetical protein